MISHSIFYLPHDTGEHVLTPAIHQAGTRSTYLSRIEGWVDLGSSLCTEMVHLSADNHTAK